MSVPQIAHRHQEALPDWAAIRDEALELGEREPLMAAYLGRLIPEDGTLEEALAMRLSDMLDGPGIGAADLRDLFLGVMAEAPEVGARAAVDLRAVYERDPACVSYLHAFLNLRGFQALQAYRLAHVLWEEGREELAAFLSSRVAGVLGPDIHPAALLGQGIMLDHGSGIVIGETCVVGDDVSILQSVTLGGTGKDCGDRHPKVGRGVMIGAGAKVLGNIRIGALSKVAAGSVVLRDVPERCTVAGVPAEIVRIHGDADTPSEVMNQGL